MYFKIPLEIVCRLPTAYPLSKPPNVFVRCPKHNLSRKFTEELSNYILKTHETDCSILDIIEWIKENIDRFIDSNHATTTTSSPSSKSNATLTFNRLWIYSHHIYSVNKRKNIIQWAKDLELSGFCMPGKPGIICVN